MLKQNKKFNIVFTSYIVGIITPITLVGIITVCVFFNCLADDARKLNYDVMNYTQNTFDYSFDTVSSLSLQMYRTTAIYDTIYDFDKSRVATGLSMWGLRSEIKKISCTKEIENIGIYIPAIDTFIDKNRTYSMEEFFQTHICDKTKKDFAQDLSLAKSKNILLKMKNHPGDNNMLFLKPFDLTRKDSAVVFYAILNSNVISDYISRQSFISFALRSGDGNMPFVFGKFPDISPEHFDKRNGTFKAGKNTFFYFSSKTAPVKYVYVYKNNALSNNAYVFAYWFAGLLLFALILSYILTKRRIGDTVSSLIDENSRLNADINQGLDEIRRQKLINYIYNISPDNVFEDVTSTYDIDFKSNAIAVICTSNSLSEKIDQTHTSEPNSKFCEKLSHVLSEKGCHSAYLCTDAAAVCITDVSGIEIPALSAICKQCIEDFASEDMCVGIGDVVSELGLLWKSYDTAIQALRCALSDTDNSVVFYNDIRSTESSEILFTDIKEVSLLKNISIGAKDKVSDLMDELYTSNFSSRNLSSGALTRLIANLSLAAYKAVKDTFSDCAQFEKYDRVINNIMKNKNPEEAFAMLREVFFALCDERKEFGSETNFRSEVIEYINNNFMDYNLSLDSLADYLGMNYHHVSRLFKKCVGSTFVGYITAVRMEKANEFLDKTDLTVKEISKKVGFLESNSFIRAYKKYYHITPAHYRKNDKI